MSLRLRACTRCKGDLMEESDTGEFTAWVCLQCGHEQENNGKVEVTHGTPVVVFTRSTRQGSPYTRNK